MRLNPYRADILRVVDGDMMAAGLAVAMPG